MSINSEKVNLFRSFMHIAPPPPRLGPCVYPPLARTLHGHGRDVRSIPLHENSRGDMTVVGSLQVHPRAGAFAGSVYVSERSACRATVKPSVAGQTTPVF